ncbi:3-oxoacyl-[acyl-carrier-protein] synthase III C-terminal domain-containing protein [Actinophytocola glycyrrhizae]|uniref:3-oxoacyl-[acyl-carrier-protein] synthase III C-terminal domain-containing protein n=1 Tax=Actinophytocola glycyrrhizae TaxID=2044873 RepID=A0ABV9S846_9PSEU
MGTALPSRTVTNDDILAEITAHSADGFDGDLGQAVRKIGNYLRYTGSDERRWRADEERPIDLLRDAANTALAQAELAPGQIDVLVYTGIGRGFIEPGGAYHSAAALGLGNAHCFDILDACMSWTRAVQVVEALFACGQYRTAMIVNAEFSLGSGGAVFPHLYRLGSIADLESVFPAYTLGEAATATVLTAEDNEPWEFRFISRPDLAPLCNVPLEGYEGYSDPSGKLAANGVGRFTSYGFELHREGAAHAMAVFERLGVRPDTVAALFTHASGKNYWQGMADKVGLGGIVEHVYHKTGNVVSASVPVAMSEAIAAGRLRRGERGVGWLGSAGMSFCAFTFVL